MLFLSWTEDFPTSLWYTYWLPGIPGYSMAICIFFEKRFKDSLYDYQKLFGISRYFDDLRALVAYKKGDKRSKDVATKIIKLLSSKCYHESMILIPEESSNNTFTFLESQISLSNKNISAFMFSKNFLSLLSNGKFSSVNAQQFHSFTGESKYRLFTRMGTVLGRLSAAESYSYPPENLFISFIHLYIQFRALEYPPAFIQSACMRKYHSSKNIVWKIIATFIPFLESL